MKDRFKNLFLNDKFILVVILINSILIYLQVSGYEDKFIGSLDMVCTLIFLLEMIVKHRVYGVRAYWRDGWNRLDGTLVILSLPSVAALFIPNEYTGLSLLMIFRLLRVLRFFRVLHFFPNFSKFPILDKALSLYDYKDLMVRNTSRNIFLSILKINDNKLINFLTSFPICVYYPNLIFTIRNLICEISKIKIEENKKNVSEFQNKNDDIVEILYYISDILSLNIESINFLIINTLLQELILPLINNLIKEKKRL
jgi:hypothetical protein